MQRAALSAAAATVSLAPATAALLEGVRKGERYSLARAITLVESTVPEHRAQARVLMGAVAEWLLSPAHPLRRAHKTSIRIGLSGSPGVGKSTLIEALGMHLVGLGHHVAVLAVDPSSARSGGSILGDKTRMVELSRDQRAYVRPSPSRGTLGGVARNTTEAILLCEGAGYDVVLVETVGVGQSETTVADMVDLFVLLVPPAGGDELQGIKKGIMEMADLIVVTKADGDLLPAARRAHLEYTSALKFMQPKSTFWRPKVLSVSALAHDGMQTLTETVRSYYEAARPHSSIELLRGTQRRTWMWRMATDAIMSELEDAEWAPDARTLLADLGKQVYEGSTTPGAAADIIVHRFLRR